jgi:KaiC/GvpD/RAD55 family RecA-like ATPase
MVEESDIVGFLKDHDGAASLEEISERLGVAKYGPESTYALLQSLRTRGLVDRRGELWVLLGPEAILSKTEVTFASHSEKKKTEAFETPEVEKIIEAMTKTFAEAMKKAKAPADEWELATEPMQTEIEAEKEKLSSLVLRPDVASEAKKPLVGFSTGTFMDQLFLNPEGKPLDGIPICGQFTITGLPSAGKSILAEEIAVRVAASGRKVLFATAEDAWKSATPRFDLQSRMKHKADILGLDWKKIMDNLFVLDTVAFSELRDWNAFAKTYRYVVEEEKIELAIIDSINFFESYRGALKYSVMELARYNQLKGVTGLYINQRSVEIGGTHEIACGIGLAYNLDGTLVVDYARVYSQDQQLDLEAKCGEFVRIVRVLDCRICNFERRRIRIDTSPDGFIKVLGAIPNSPE